MSLNIMTMNNDKDTSKFNTKYNDKIDIFIINNYTHHNMKKQLNKDKRK